MIGPSSGEMAVTLHDLLDSGLCPLFKCLFFFILFYFPTLFKLLRDPEVLKSILEENLKLAKMALCCYTIFFPFVKKKTKQNQVCNVCNFIAAVLWRWFCVLVHSLSHAHTCTHTQAIFLKPVHPSPFSWLC